MNRAGIFICPENFFVAIELPQFAENAYDYRINGEIFVEIQPIIF